MRIFAMPQGSPEWFQVRAGVPTASRFSEIATTERAELSESAENYADELIGECFVPDFQYFKGNMHTRRGHELEPAARERFMSDYGLDVHEVGFVKRAAGITGCSPDGLILSDQAGLGWIAGLEIKCPTPKTHVAYHCAGRLPDAYKQQVHGSMFVTGLNRWHFVSYCEGMAPFYLTVEADDYTARLGKTVLKFEELYKNRMRKVKEKLNDIK